MLHFTRITKVIGECVDAAEYDALAKVAVSVLQKSERVLPLLSVLVNNELKVATSTRKFSVFRGNNFVSALEKAFVSLLFPNKVYDNCFHCV